jgi:hypothetical protein
MPSRMPLGLAVASSWLLAGLPVPVRAAELVARGPSGCPDARELEFRVERRMSMPLERAAPLRFDVTMEPAVSGHRASIVVAPGGLRRELVASNCEELADAVSIAVALALGSAPPAPPAGSGGEPAGTAEPLPPRGAEPAPPAAAGAMATSDEEDSMLSASLERSASLPDSSLSLWLLADAGSLPTPGVGAGLGAEAAWRRFELHVLATLLFEQETRVESATLARPGAKLALWTGAALGCTSPWGARGTAVTPFICLGLEVGRLAGVGTGVPEPRRGGALWLAPVVQLGAAWRIPDSALRLEVALLGAAPLNRDEFNLRDLGTVHQPSPAIGRLSFGVGLDL